MSAGIAVAVAIGAALGAPLRYAVERRLAASWPWGTFSVNVAGSLVLGVLLGAVAAGSVAEGSALVALVGVGFCGSLTTFGGFAAQVLDLGAGAGGSAPGARPWAGAAVYAAISALACVAVAWAAYVTVGTFLA